VKDRSAALKLEAKLKRLTRAEKLALVTARAAASSPRSTRPARRAPASTP
jgi:predicted GIY-YIG superfamily endonuclease